MCAGEPGYLCPRCAGDLDHAKRESARRGLLEKAVRQIRDSLATLSYAEHGFYEDEAQVALDALDWLEANAR